MSLTGPTYCKNRYNFENEVKSWFYYCLKKNK